jgi:hypothetical protein
LDQLRWARWLLAVVEKHEENKARTMQTTGSDVHAASFQLSNLAFSISQKMPILIKSDFSTNS